MDSDKLARRKVAELLGVHQDSVTRVLPEGLASAVITWGGRGKRMTFSRELVLRWHRARLCHRGHSARPCSKCSLVLEDAAVAAEHLLEARHGAHEICDDPGGCGWPGGMCRPCA